MRADFEGPWGLRGDPLLWGQLRLALAQTPLPATVADLHQHLHATFQDITGHPLVHSQIPLAVSGLRRPNGGMSNGLVSPEFWLETGFPTIERAFSKEMQKRDAV